MNNPKEMIWARLKSNPNIIFKLHHTPAKKDHVVEYYLPSDTARHCAWIDEIEFIDETEIPTDILYLWGKYEYGQDTTDYSDVIGGKSV